MTIKICKCRGAHNGFKALPTVKLHHYCQQCGMLWCSMVAAKPDGFGRFVRGDVVLHWKGDKVNIIDVGEPLIARVERVNS